MVSGEEWHEIYWTGMKYAFLVAFLSSPLGAWISKLATDHLNSKQDHPRHGLTWENSLFMFGVFGVPFGMIVLLISSCFTLVLAGASASLMFEMQAYNPGFWVLVWLCSCYKIFDVFYMTPWDDYQLDTFAFVLGYFEKVTLLGLLFIFVGPLIRIRIRSLNREK